MMYKRIAEALEQKEELFKQEHETDSDAALLQYLKACAKLCGHSPNREEVIGGSLIEQRFGDWDNAIRMSGLRRVSEPPEYKKRYIVRQEWEIQYAIYRKEREQRQEKKRARLAAQQSRARKSS